MIAAITPPLPATYGYMQRKFRALQAETGTLDRRQRSSSVAVASASLNTKKCRNPMRQICQTYGTFDWN
jgi:hypothetical protein